LYNCLKTKILVRLPEGGARDMATIVMTLALSGVLLDGSDMDTVWVDPLVGFG